MKNISYLSGGVIFGFGLALSGMVKPEIIISFLELKDLGLLLVMGSGTAVTMLGFWLIPKIKKRAVNKKPFRLRVQTLDKKLIVGSSIFGIGWGLSGLCPGAAIASIGVGNYPVIIALLSMVIGSYTWGFLYSKKN